MTRSPGDVEPYGVLYLSGDELDLLRLVVTKVLFQLESNKVRDGEEEALLALTASQREQLGEVLARIGDELFKVLGGRRGD